MTERATGHLRLRSWLALVATVLAMLTSLLGAGTTTASAASFTYDAPAVARVDIFEFRGADASPAKLNGTPELSALPPVEADGASTTPIARSVATEAAETSIYRGVATDHHAYGRGSRSTRFLASPR